MSTSVSPTNPTGPTTSPSTTPSSSSGGLSTGAKAGIGAGVGGVALIALIVLALFLWRRRKQRQIPYGKEQNHYGQEKHASELGGGQRHELGDESRAEMPYETVKYEHQHSGSEVTYEMPGEQYQSPVELPSTAVGPNAR